MSETFGAMLRRARMDVGLSQNMLARYATIDPAYVNRMEIVAHRWLLRPAQMDEPVVPSRPVVLRLVEVLELDQDERDRFLFAAGHAPERDWQAIAEQQQDALQDALNALDVIRAAVGSTAERPTPLRQERRA